MRFYSPKKPETCQGAWKRYFAWWPTRIDDTTKIWLEYYEARIVEEFPGMDMTPYEVQYRPVS